jgi:hypothetical protein
MRWYRSPMRHFVQSSTVATSGRGSSLCRPTGTGSMPGTYIRGLTTAACARVYKIRSALPCDLEPTQGRDARTPVTTPLEP